MITGDIFNIYRRSGRVMIMNQPGICDYTNYNYNDEFWKKTNREYEHLLEVSMVNTLLSKHADKKNTIMDAGCGFGRLYPSYNGIFTNYILVDYAQSLLDEAKQTLGQSQNISFIQQSLYDLEMEKKVDAIISIRTLHHLHDVEPLFKRLYNSLSDSGILILDIPNYYHIKNRIKSPFIKRIPKVKQSENFFNYDPDYIIRHLKKCGFSVIDQRCLGLFRSPVIKKLISPKLLVGIETYLNRWIKWLTITPSVVIVVKKCG